MADIELVIKIPEETVIAIKDNAMFAKEIASSIKWDITGAIVNGTPLPKGHGRLIDADSIHKIIRPIEQSDTKWGMTAETAKRLVYDAFNFIPTIIEADKGE